MISSKKNIKVFIFTSVHPWNDIRIFYKQATSLGKKYSVELHGPARFNKKIINNITVYGLPLWTNKKDRIKTYFILMKRIWISNADIYHFHDPELILHGICLKLLRRKKVIYDVHENSIQIIKERSWIPSIYKKFLIILYLILEKLSVCIFDKIVLAEESYKSFIQENTVIIFNFPLIKQYFCREEKTVDAIYVGGVLEERGAFEMIKIAKYVADKIPNFTMKIVGPIGQFIEKNIYRYIIDNNLEKKVILTGRLDYKVAMKEIKKARVGLAILHPKGNYVHSIPTKLFEYMSCELPYIASDFQYWRSFFRGERTGYFVKHNNIQQAAEKIITLLADGHLRNQLGKKGRELVEKNFNWVSEEKKLLTVYKSIEY